MKNVIIVGDGRVARSLAKSFRQAGIPAVVSYHAGTFLCNATMYLTHHWCQVNRHPIQVGFVHLPLSTEQVAGSGRSLASLPVATMAQAVRLLIEDVADGQVEV